MIGPKALVPLVEDIIGHVTGSGPCPASVVDALDTVLRDGDDADAFGLCMVLGALGRRGLVARFPETSRGHLWGVLRECIDQPHELFALRFMAAYMNQDTAMCAALLHATQVGTRDRADSIRALVAKARALCAATGQGPGPGGWGAG